MIYNSPETIPAKLYYKILETGNVKLLGIGTDEELNKAWVKIEEEYSKIKKNENKDLKKVLDLSKQIESIESRLRFTELAIYHLRHLKDDELIEKLKKYGYSFNWKKPEKEDAITEAIFQEDIDRIERESEALTIKIARLQQSMPKKAENEEDKNEIPFDETVLTYAAFTGLGYVDPNTLPLTQYDAMIVNGNKKMKALETPRSNGRK